jgi:DNA repair protein RecO (recombination protein O)
MRLKPALPNSNSGSPARADPGSGSIAVNLRAPAILLASRHHGETGAILRALTANHGLVAGYVAGGRGRQLRPVMIPGNRIALDLTMRSASQLPFAKIELEHSRAPFMTEPLPAAAIGWVCALTASTLPERAPFPALYDALDGLLDAICVAPSARGWLGALASYETMLLREMGYGESLNGLHHAPAPDLAAQIAALDMLAAPLVHYLLADARGDVMAARIMLMERLARIG